ncbi:hypothetical protein [Acinetobacter gerneri]
MPQISVISETSRKVLQQTNTINNIGLTENSLVVLSIGFKKFNFKEIVG